MTDWQPIATATKDRKRRLLATVYPKARYPIVTGAWNDRLGEWRSEPGGWPFKPTHWADMPELPE